MRSAGKVSMPVFLVIVAVQWLKKKIGQNADFKAKGNLKAKFNVLGDRLQLSYENVSLPRHLAFQLLFIPFT